MANSYKIHVNESAFEKRLGCVPLGHKKSDFGFGWVMWTFADKANALNFVENILLTIDKREGVSIGSTLKRNNGNVCFCFQHGTGARDQRGDSDFITVVMVEKCGPDLDMPKLSEWMD